MSVLKELLFNLSRYSYAGRFILLGLLVNRAFLCILQMLNKEHEKAEDSKPVAVPTAAGS